MSDLLTGKTVLLTGATGFIGNHLLRRLAESGAARLVTLTRRPIDALPEGIAGVIGSLHEAEPGMWKSAGISKFDIVFHFGAFTPKTPAEANRVEEICRDNIDGTRALLTSLPAVPDRIVYASTLDVYAPGTNGEPVHERSPLGPTGLYGGSKLFCEQLVRTMAKERGASAVVLRYGHIFGPGEEAYGKLIPRMIKTLLAGEQPKLFGDGSALRDYLYVSDAVEATLRAAEVGLIDDTTINIVRGASTPILTVAEILVQLTGARSGIRLERERPSGQSLWFDNRRMRDVLGEWPLVSLEDGLRLEVESMSAND